MSPRNNGRYAYDCAHLHACRRMALIQKSRGVNIPRGCDFDCTAYEAKHEPYPKISLDAIIGACYMVQEGYGPFEAAMEAWESGVWEQ